MTKLHRSYRNFRENPVEFARRDLERVPEFVSSEKGGEGYLRGVDFYEGDRLTRAYARAIGNFYEMHQRLPDVTPPRFSQEHMFLSKFYRYFPTSPNPAAKHIGLSYLSETLREKMFLPCRVVLETPGDLLRLKSLPGKKVLIKPSLGNSTNIQTDSGGFFQNRKHFAGILKKQYGHRYGVQVGEWIYGVGRQSIVIEEDLSDISTGFEYQIFVRKGQVRLFRKSTNLALKTGSLESIEHAHFYPDGTYCAGKVFGRSELDDRDLPTSIDLMMSVAKDIGAHFDAIRVDMFDTENGVALGELTCFSYNARFRVTTPELEALFVEAFSMTD